jgi:protein-S-isoprenylcysteine O-methyltransferase Ste14
MKRLLKDNYAFFRVFYIIISVVLLVPLISFTNQLDNKVLIPDAPFLNAVRYVFTAGSLAMFFWAFFFSYDFLSFFGIRQIINFGRQKTADSSGIRKSGLLGVVRHPMYLALIIYLWFQTHTMMNIIVNAVLTVYVLIGTWLEEKKLVLEFGEPYVKYQQEVPMIIPSVKIGRMRRLFSREVSNG